MLGNITLRHIYRCWTHRITHKSRSAMIEKSFFITHNHRTYNFLWTPKLHQFISLGQQSFNSHLHIAIRPHNPAFPTISRQCHAKRHQLLKVSSTERWLKCRMATSQVAITKDDPTDHQDRATKRPTVSTTHREAAAADRNDPQGPRVFTKASQEQDQKS